MSLYRPPRNKGLFEIVNQLYARRHSPWSTRIKQRTAHPMCYTNHRIEMQLIIDHAIQMAVRECDAGHPELLYTLRQVASFFWRHRILDCAMWRRKYRWWFRIDEKLVPRAVTFPDFAMEALRQVERDAEVVHIKVGVPDPLQHGLVMENTIVTRDRLLSAAERLLYQFVIAGCCRGDTGRLEPDRDHILHVWWHAKKRTTPTNAKKVLRRFLHLWLENERVNEGLFCSEGCSYWVFNSPARHDHINTLDTLRFVRRHVREGVDQPDGGDDSDDGSA